MPAARCWNFEQIDADIGALPSMLFSPTAARLAAGGAVGLMRPRRACCMPWRDPRVSGLVLLEPVGAH